MSRLHSLNLRILGLEGLRAKHPEMTAEQVAKSARKIENKKAKHRSAQAAYNALCNEYSSAQVEGAEIIATVCKVLEEVVRTKLEGTTHTKSDQPANNADAPAAASGMSD